MAEVMASYVPQNSHDTIQTQPHEAPSMGQENVTISDPSFSSNSTILTGDNNHRTRSASSQSTESPAAEMAKSISVDKPVPLPLMSREEQDNDYYSTHSPMSSSYVVASSPPPETSTEQATYFTASDARAPSIQSNEIDSSQVSPPQSPSSHVRRPIKTRARSTSSGVLARLTSRSSCYISDLIDPGSPTSSHVSGDSPSKPKLDRAALAKSRGKYKSGVNWDSSPMNLAARQEPFKEQASLPVEKTMEEIEESLKAAEMEQMAAAGSTKAAIAWSRANSFGDPIFATHRRAMAEASAKALQAATGTPLPPAPGSLRTKSTISRSPTDGGRILSNIRFNSGEMNEIKEDASSRNGDNTREGSQFINSQDIITTGGQVVLDLARKAAAYSVDAQFVNTESEQRNPPSTLSPLQEISAEEVQRKSKSAKRKTFLGFGGGKKEKKKEKGKEDKVASEDGSAERQTTPDSNGQPSREDSRPSSIKQEANGTTSRRRRFNDTRQLNLLANELAAEAMMEAAPDSYPSLMPETRRASMMSLLAATNGDMGASLSNTSQISLQPGSLLSMPQPAFVSNEFGARSGSPAGGSSRSNSPRFGANDLPRFDPPRAPFARSQPSLSTPNSPLASQKAKLTGLPADMLTGLGDGPYPTLPARGLELSDSFMISTLPLESRATAYDRSSQGRNSLPDVFTRSRGASASSAPLPKRSVLQMSMHNPEAEMQGLTKPLKSSRNSPFTSRASSKQVTPKSSFINLEEKANGFVSPTLLSQELAKSSLNETRVSPLAPTSSSREGENLEGQGKNENKEEDKGGKDSIRSFFKLKSKSKIRLTESHDETSNNHLLPPGVANSTSKAQSLHSNGSENHYKGNQQLRAASHSAHSLVNMPSPTHSNTTASASSHDLGAFAYSSDGGSHQQEFSTVTTPEALPAKMELSTLSNNTLDARPSTPSPNERLATNNERRSASPLGMVGTPIQSNRASPLGMVGTPIQSNRASPILSTPRSTGATSKSSATASTFEKMNKFRSMFVSTKTPPQQQQQMTAAPVNHYPTNGLNEKGNSRVNLPISNGQQRMPSENGVPKERIFKNFQAKIQEKMII